MGQRIPSGLVAAESAVPVPSASGTEKGLNTVLLNEGPCRKTEAMKSERAPGHHVELARVFCHEMADERPTSPPLSLEGRCGQE